MKKLFLTEPTERYKKSFQNYALDYNEAGEDAYYFKKYSKALTDFSGFVRHLIHEAHGTHLPKGRVASSTFWLIDQHEVVGVVRIRHQEVRFAGHIGYDVSPKHRNKGYGTQILNLALAKARELGIKKAVVTCRTNNEPSKRIIEKNGGTCLGTLYNKEEDKELFKYVIDTVNCSI
ncbi:GNAT family N-acetyltransferase [Sporolactobacillus shoreicorticis]|uniref:GNAT family N-acetyltransferase n=1 Tax=Sporolactobacillus shoreicorticis TaxID=1923877 RepID=A0ABW5S272_9BACL|nr:GNAT family N-acetyltransferase [Sporolactobacillus shoreicorticis]MCO7126495.1 GNAT family N-acetyltransferase [Sporolactobacillus shoreicorticis]